MKSLILIEKSLFRNRDIYIYFQNRDISSFNRDISNFIRDISNSNRDISIFKRDISIFNRDISIEIEISLFKKVYVKTAAHR